VLDHRDDPVEFTYIVHSITTHFLASVLDSFYASVLHIALTGAQYEVVMSRSLTKCIEFMLLLQVLRLLLLGISQHFVCCSQYKDHQ